MEVYRTDLTLTEYSLKGNDKNRVLGKLNLRIQKGKKQSFLTQAFMKTTPAQQKK